MGNSDAHTRTQTEVGPDYCDECSHRAEDWVAWAGNHHTAILTEALARAAEVREVILDLVAAVEDEQMAYACKGGLHPGVEAARVWLTEHGTEGTDGE